MIYLDNAATTRMHDTVVHKMVKCMTDVYGNAESKHTVGFDAKKEIDYATHIIASSLGCNDDQIIYTGSGTEANNLVIRGIADHLIEIGRTTIVTSSIEHESVINSATTISAERCLKYIKLKPNREGRIDDYERFLGDDVGFVSVMMTNNETGVTNDVKSIAKACRERGILFHTDCVQAAGCCKINVDDIGCDFLTISAHKIYGPKGVALLYARDKNLLKPIVIGGDNQEHGLRGGTENVPGIAGFGTAVWLIDAYDFSEMIELKKTFIKLLRDKGIDFKVNGDSINTLGKTINICINGIDADTLTMILDCNGVCVSTGSACRSLVQEPSYVLTEMGIDEEDARCSIRISFSQYTTIDDLIKATDIIKKSVDMINNNIF